MIKSYSHQKCAVLQGQFPRQSKNVRRGKTDTKHKLRVQLASFPSRALAFTRPSINERGLCVATSFHLMTVPWDLLNFFFCWYAYGGGVIDQSFSSWCDSPPTHTHAQTKHWNGADLRLVVDSSGPGFEDHLLTLQEITIIKLLSSSL